MEPARATLIAALLLAPVTTFAQTPAPMQSLPPDETNLSVPDDALISDEMMQSIAEEVDAAPVIERERFAMSISGGVSLGAYEAGMNWSLVRLLRAEDARLEVVTGASAGNINAFLTAAEWCRSGKSLRAAPHFTESFFWDAWVPLGLTQLFPGTRNCKRYHEDLEAWSGEPPPDCPDPNGSPYGSDDAMFSRKPGEPTLNALSEFFAQEDEFRACELPLGVTVTRQEPAELKISDALSVPTQRYVAPVMACADGSGGLHFQNFHPRGCDALSLDGTPTFADVGKVLYSPSDENGVVDFDQIRRIMYASSAFPVAFQPVNVPFCEAPDEAFNHISEFGNQTHFAFDNAPAVAEANGLICSEDNALSEVFLDGGVFDNVPLSLAVYMLDSKRRLEAPKPTELIYLDPDTRRLKQQLPKKPMSTSPGLGQAFQFAESFVGVSRRYELQFLARKREILHNIQLPATTRFANIFGDYLVNFSAFFAQAFREYDFYAGIYDAARHWALRSCEAKDQSCIVNAMPKVIDQLAPADDARNADVRYTFFSLLEEECVLVSGDCPTFDKGKPHPDIKILVDTQIVFRRTEDVAIRCRNIPGWNTRVGKEAYRECLERSNTTVKTARKVMDNYFRTLIYHLRDETEYETAFEDRLKLDYAFRKRFTDQQIKDEKAIIRSYDLTLRKLLEGVLARSRELETQNNDGVSIYVSNAAEFALASWLDLAHPEWRAFPSTVRYYPNESRLKSIIKAIAFHVMPHSISLDLSADERTREYEYRFVSTPAYGERWTLSLVGSGRFGGRGHLILPGGRKNNLLAGIATLLYLNPFIAFELVLKGGLESETFTDPFGRTFPDQLMPGGDIELRGVLGDRVTISPGMTILARDGAVDTSFRLSLGFRDFAGFVYWFGYRFLFGR